MMGRAAALGTLTLFALLAPSHTLPAALNTPPAALPLGHHGGAVVAGADRAVAVRGRILRHHDEVAHEENLTRAEGCQHEEGEGQPAFGSSAFWLNTVICIVLVLSAGVFSGLTIGLMAIDTSELKTIIRADSNPDDPNEILNARRILPLVEKHHLLLVTLLLANAAAMEALPIFLNKICPSELVAILVSVTAVLFFGEVIPQALCSAYGLAIGAKTAPFVDLLMMLLYPIAKPIAMALDRLFGHSEHRYRKAEFKALFNLHLEPLPHEEHEGGSPAAKGHEEFLNNDETTVMRAALDLTDKTAGTKGVLTPLKDVFMLDSEAVMDYETMAKILDSGHSRVPICDGEPHNVIGYIIVKSLIMLNPADATPIAHCGIQTERLLRVPSTIGLYTLIDKFQLGATHMALVYDGQPMPEATLLGVTTLEDILEELLNEEIVDETDKFENVVEKTKASRMRLWMPPNTAKSSMGNLLPDPGNLPQTPSVLRESRARQIVRKTVNASIAMNRMRGPTPPGGTGGAPASQAVGTAPARADDTTHSFVSPIAEEDPDTGISTTSSKQTSRGGMSDKLL